MSRPTKVDVLVVGAGPAGSTAALLLSRAGLRVMVVESKRRPGLGTPCSGILGPLAWEALPLRDESWIVGDVRWAEFESPGGVRFRIDGDRRLAVVVDREVMDREISEAAASEGAEILTRTRLVRLTNGRAELKSPSESLVVRYTYLIGADGANSRVRTLLGVRSPGLEVGVNARCRSPNPDGYSVKLRGGSSFSWVQPGPSGRMRGALGPLGSPLLAWALDGDCEVREIRGGLIPRRPLRRLTHKIGTSWALFVGDAAGQVKPLSRGGIFWGVSGAKMAASAVIGHVEGRCKPSVYDAAWWTQFRREVALGLAIRRFLERLSLKQLDRLISLIREREKELSAAFHVDLQGATAVKVLSAQLAIHSTAVSPVAATAAAVTLVKELMGVGI